MEDYDYPYGRTYETDDRRERDMDRRRQNRGGDYEFGGSSRWQDRDVGRGGDVGRGNYGRGDFGRGSDFERGTDFGRRGDFGRGMRRESGYNYGQERGRRGRRGRDSGYRRDSGWGEGEAWSTEGPFTGYGPRDYQRSNERLEEEACERLTHHGRVDARNIRVTADNGEITLEGTVNSRREKRQAEEALDTLWGIRDIHNRLRVRGREEDQNVFEEAMDDLT